MLAMKSDVVVVYRRLLSYVRPHWILIAAAAGAAVIYALVSGVVPFLLKEVISQLEGGAGRNSGDAYRIPLLIVVIFPVGTGMDFIAQYCLGRVGRSVIRDLRDQLFGHYLALPARFYDGSSTGMLISKLTFNTEQVAEAISNAVVILLRDSLAIVIQLGVMMILSPQLTLLMAIIGPAIGFFLRVMSRALRRYATRIQNSMGDVTKITEESLHGNRVVKIFEGQEYERRHFAEVNARNFRQNVRLVATRAAGESITQYTVAIGFAAVVYVAFSDWMVEGLTAPVFVGFFTAMGQLLTPVRRLTNINAAVQRGIAAAASLFETLDEPPEEDTGTRTIARARGDVEYSHVSFSYESEKGGVLNDVSLVVPAGSSLALVGQSGSGKSTLVSLLPRFYDVQAGAVLLDGEDVRSYRLRDLRRQVSLVSQDVVLFDDTIANNIAYGALAECSREDVERAAKAAYVTEFTADLPAGLDTLVGERGALLSGGQRQRIAIARALLKDAPVLILDEATSALDTESERRIQAALAQLMKGRTTLVIAHRLSTIESADRIVVLRQGSIVEIGSHRELMARGGYYSTLHRMQFTD
jgi:ATP-binding cassette, subfamily B, bacterial MsbA